MYDVSDNYNIHVICGYKCIFNTTILISGVLGLSYLTCVLIGTHKHVTANSKLFSNGQFLYVIDANV